MDGVSRSRGWDKEILHGVFAYGTACLERYVGEKDCSCHLVHTPFSFSLK